MRAGTSRGPFFLSQWLPAEATLRDRVLVSAIGSTDSSQINGLGGGTSLTSKVAIVSPSTRSDCDVDYLFAQVGVGSQTVDTRPNCGNMLAGVAPFAIEQGLVIPSGEETAVRVHNVNTGARIDVSVHTPQGRVQYDGDVRIDGVAEPGAPIYMSFLDAWGAVTGQLFPTGSRTNVVDGVPVTCIDAAMPLVIIPASALGFTGRETPGELEAHADRMQRIERIRRQAGALMGLGDVSDSVVPKPVLVAEGDDADSLHSRYFTPHRCHTAHAVTGAIGVATAFVLPGTVASGRSREIGRHAVRVCHPSGSLQIAVDLAGQGDERRVERASVVRTARKILEGRLELPAHVLTL